jgi:hypothetical protein
VSITNLLAVLTLVVGVPLNAYVVWRLGRLHRANPDLMVLRERGIVGTAVLINVVVFGLIFVNNDIVPPILGLDLTKLITRAVVLFMAIVPALYWLRLYRKA